MQRISSFCCFILLAFSSLILAEKNHCGKHGPHIRYPFSFNASASHPKYPPAFVVSCNEKKELNLKLPVKLAIKAIDYKAQRIKLYDPEDCLLYKLLKPENLSSIFSPFRYLDSSLINITLFNCSSAQRESSTWYGYPLELVRCYDAHSPGYQVYWTSSSSSIEDYPLLSCTKMANYSLVPYTDRSRDFYLEWSDPKCRACEEEGKICQPKIDGNSSSEIQCLRMKKQGISVKILGVSLGSLVLVLLAGAAYSVYYSDRKEKHNQSKIEKFLDDYKALKPSRYAYADIKRITDDFKDKLGQGAYGTVYKGKLSSECFVAVKVLTNTKGDGEEFVNEVGTMGHIHHVNVVRLVGFCADGFRRALVYDFLPNGSLQDFITSSDNKNSFLGWDKLQDIALGIAKGIEYLHQGCDQRILHFDIKPHNVLLDHNFTPKISDFGLAKLCSKDQSIVSMTTARGTMGYIAPEVFSRNFGNVSYKSDVYSYGMVLLEMVGGRKNISSSTDDVTGVYYPEWIYNLLEGGEDIRIHVGEEAEASIAKTLAIVGLWCIQWHPVDRPSMNWVVQMLEGGENLTMPPNPFASQGPPGTNANTPRRLNLQLEAIAELE